MDPIIKDHGGRIANTAGDSVIAEFSSPLKATQAAISIQSAHGDHNSSVQANKRLMYRIGVNVGEIYIQDNGDILGDGVNIAARLESLAPPGGICISENVQMFIIGKIYFMLTKIGEHYVKNIDKQINVYAAGRYTNYNLYINTINNIFKKREFQFFLYTSVFILLLMSVWLIISISDDGVVDSEFLEKMKQAQTVEGMLESFEVVTIGEFQESKYYVITDWPGSFEEYNEVAGRLGGHPVAIGSKAENDFLFQFSLKDRGHWRMATDVNQISGPMIGMVQAEGAVEPDGGWHWANGEEVKFVAWKGGSPDNWEGDQGLALFHARGNKPRPEWDDMRSMQRSFIVEVPLERNN